MKILLITKLPSDNKIALIINRLVPITNAELQHSPCSDSKKTLKSKLELHNWETY